MKINKKDFLNLKTLIETGCITEGKFSNKELVKQLKLNGSVVDGKRTPKIRYIQLANALNIFILLKNFGYNIASVEEIERYIEEIFENKPSRDTIQEWRNDSKAINSPSLKGLYVSSLHVTKIKLNSEVISILPTDGIGYFLFHTETIELFPDTVIIGVENYQVIWFAKRYKEFFNMQNSIFVVINPYMLEWISGVENQYIHFGDYDLAGINIYLNKVFPKLQDANKASMFIPDNIAFLIEKHGDTALYEKQKQYTNLLTDDVKILDLINSIKYYKKAIEQEGLHRLSKQSQR